MKKVLFCLIVLMTVVACKKSSEIVIQSDSTIVKTDTVKVDTLVTDSIK